MSKRKKYRIEEIAEKVGIGPFGSSIKVDTFVEDGIPVISGMHLKGMRLEDKDFNFISIEHADKLKNANVKRGDVIFTHAGNIGAVAFIPENSKYDRYMLSQRQFYLRCNKEKLLPEYITYYFKSPLGQKQLLANASSVGVPSIARPVTNLRSIEIEIPDLKEQEEVTKILESLENKIELNQQMNETLEAIAQVIFKRWFVDFNFDGFDGELIDGLPKGWRIGSILEIATLLSGGTPKTDVPEYWNGAINWISAKDITNSNNQFIIETEKTITELGIQKSAAKLLPKLTTIVSARGTVGNYCILSKEMAISQSNYGLKSNSNFDYFLFLMIETMIMMMKAFSYGTVFDTITTKTFQEMEVTIPNNEVIERFENIIMPLYKKILANQFQIQSLTQIRDSLLPKLMTGKIELNN